MAFSIAKTTGCVLAASGTNLAGTAITSTAFLITREIRLSFTKKKKKHAIALFLQTVI